jgi:hypothetical protein
MSNVNKVKHPLGMHNTYWPVASVDASNTERAKESIVHPFIFRIGSSSLLISVTGGLVSIHRTCCTPPST